MQIAGRSALVTGGASGLGEAVARALAAQGAKVSVFDVNIEAAQAIAGQLGCLAFPVDVTSEQEVAGALKQIEAIHGTPTIVVNCAGIGAPSRVVGKEGPMELSQFEKIVRVNLLGSFNVLRLAAHAMTLADAADDNSRGVIINTASVAAFDGQIGQAAYAASKGGIVAMALPIARELARFGIRVNTVAPGIFRTPLLQSLPATAQASIAQDIPFPARFGEPAEFAHAIIFCIENDYMNGEIIRLDAAHRLGVR